MTCPSCGWAGVRDTFIGIVEGREARVHREPPGPDRWKKRSITFQGIADAMAEQWGSQRILSGAAE